MHVDIKPENVLVSRDFHLKVADFGSAQDLKGYEAIVNFEGGTVTYLSPERRSSDRLCTTACDIFALGVMMNEACNCKLYEDPLDCAPTGFVACCARA